MIDMVEQVNRIEILGMVGACRVDEYAARFTVATNYCYLLRDGSPVVETTWHNVSAFLKGAGMGIKKGDYVRVVGRLRNLYYTASDGRERFSNEIVASSVEIIDGPCVAQGSVNK